MAKQFRLLFRSPSSSSSAPSSLSVLLVVIALVILIECCSTTAFVPGNRHKQNHSQQFHPTSSSNPKATTTTTTMTTRAHEDATTEPGSKKPKMVDHRPAISLEALLSSCIDANLQGCSVIRQYKLDHATVTGILKEEGEIKSVMTQAGTYRYFVSKLVIAFLRFASFRSICSFLLPSLLLSSCV